jgi:hypothetical protein
MKIKLGTADKETEEGLDGLCKEDLLMTRNRKA